LFKPEREHALSCYKQWNIQEYCQRYGGLLFGSTYNSFKKTLLGETVIVIDYRTLKKMLKFGHVYKCFKKTLLDELLL